mmetsp:Transcript_103536/g.288289  ORF Transcript_103536/g.288289 Transcript_103536/m.288289 type:complete len:206 (+) Transcript_103536:2864-3481(+)
MIAKFSLPGLPPKTPSPARPEGPVPGLHSSAPWRVTTSGHGLASEQTVDGSCRKYVIGPMPGTVQVPCAGCGARDRPCSILRKLTTHDVFFHSSTRTSAAGLDPFRLLRLLRSPSAVQRPADHSRKSGHDPRALASKPHIRLIFAGMLPPVVHLPQSRSGKVRASTACQQASLGGLPSSSRNSSSGWAAPTVRCATPSALLTRAV